jgi:enterochelin esterase-like enzyme
MLKYIYCIPLKRILAKIRLEATVMTNRKGSIKEINFESKSLSENIQLTIYLPESYSPLYTYPVLFALDGNDYFKLGKIIPTIEQLISNSEIKECIIVGIPYKNIQDRRVKYHPSGDKHEQYKAFIIKELTPYINQEFATHQLASGHVLMGESLAATASLLIALDYPNTFGKVIMQSPLVDDEVLSMSEKFSDGNHLTIYHVIGTQETEVKLTNGKIDDFLTPNRELNKIFESKRLDYFYDEFDGGHLWKYWQPDLKRALIYTFQ